MRKLVFGDKVLKDGDVHIVLIEKKENKYRIQNKSGGIYETNIDSLVVLPRPGEVIRVWDINRNGGSWISEWLRMFIDYDSESQYPVICLPQSEYYNKCPLETWRYFCLADEDRKKHEIDNILRMISDDDPKIMRELAEIILASREKVSK
jgi:hypothetical protein